MPLVFGFAPVVNTFASMIMSKTIKEASLLFYIGVAIVAIGAAGVLVFKPTAHKPDKTEAARVTSVLTNVAISFQEAENKDNKNSSEHDSSVANGDGKSSTTANSDTEPRDVDSGSDEIGLARKTGNWVLMVMSIIMTALCWGSYGPVLHKGQAQMGGSRLRPFLCVGLAYFVIAVIVPIPFLSGDPGKLTFMGSTWSLLAGTAGALGALGIIYAFNFGGRPIFVMPLVFGLAPVVNTMSTTLVGNLWAEIGWPFKISLALVILGAVMVLILAPKPKPGPVPAQAPPPNKSPAPSPPEIEPEQNPKQASNNTGRSESTEVAEETER